MRGSGRDLMLGTLFGLALPTGAFIYMLERHNRELVRLSRRFESLSRIDPLTGLPNRRAFEERLAVEVSRANRYRAPLALVMLDLDHFKAINDRHGHAIGDEVLRRVAGLLARGKRAGDMVARIGGEELAALLPHTDASAARGWAERMRALIARSGAPTGGMAVTASFGVAQARPPRESAPELYDAADAALFAAKQAGRDRVVLAGSTAGEEAAAEPPAGP